jgi:uncharacterized protein YeaO (DUF488 family)
MAEVRVRVRRAYEESEPGDGARVLVDRIRPRGLTKAKAALDEWCKHVAPSDELRKCTATTRSASSGAGHSAARIMTGQPQQDWRVLVDGSTSPTSMPGKFR